MANCQGCGAPVRWLKNVGSGKAAPVDVKPADMGNVRLVRMAAGEAYEVVPPSKIAALAADGVALFKLHFATCPNADHFRRCGRCHHSPCACQGALFG